MRVLGIPNRGKDRQWDLATLYYGPEKYKGVPYGEFRGLLTLPISVNTIKSHVKNKYDKNLPVIYLTLTLRGLLKILVTYRG